MLPYSPSIGQFTKDDPIDGESRVSPTPAPPQKPRSRFKAITHIYWVISWILGFNEKYSLALLIFFGGALIGLCLARTFMMSPSNVRDKTVSGEWFWYRQSLYKPCIFIHIYLSIISGIGAVFQFIPAIRRRAVILHRINGYLTLALLIPSTIAGSIVARRAFGGELNVQSAFYVDGILIVYSALMGIMKVKQTRKHRRWMLRTVAYAAVPVTTRVTSIAARHIVSDVGSYFAVWRCDQLMYVLRNVTAVGQQYPDCLANPPASSWAIVHAATHGNGGLGYASAVRVVFGMSLWVAIVLHIIGVEVYIHFTEAENQFRRGFELRRYDEDGEKISNSYGMK